MNRTPGAPTLLPTRRQDMIALVSATLIIICGAIISGVIIWSVISLMDREPHTPTATTAATTAPGLERVITAPEGVRSQDIFIWKTEAARAEAAALSKAGGLSNRLLAARIACRVATGTTVTITNPSFTAGLNGEYEILVTSGPSAGCSGHLGGAFLAKP